MKRIWIIAKNSFVESLRDKLFIVLMLTGVLLLLLSFALSELTIYEQNRILFNVGMIAIHVVMMGLTLFLGSFSLAKEFERQTYMTILSTPISRHEFFIGKWLGILLITLLSILGLSGVLYFIVRDTNLIHFSTIIFGVCLEGLVLLSISFLLSLVFEPFMALFTSLGFFVIGHWLREMEFFAQKSGSAVYLAISSFMQFVIPRLTDLNWRTYHQLEVGVEAKLLTFGAIHGVAWTFFLLFASGILIKRKNLF